VARILVEAEARLVRYEAVPPRTAADHEALRSLLSLQAGEAGAFEKLYFAYAEQLCGYLVRITRDVGLAEDGAQHALMTLLASPEKYRRADRPVRAWLFAIARNYVLDEARRRRRVHPVEPRFVTEAVPSSDDLLNDEDLRPLAVEIIRGISRLPAPQRDVIAWRTLAGWSFEEIAARIGLTQANVRQIHHRGLVQLRERLPG
jgi:RNA polymerase sigma-70 factor, ECF subfamily